MLFPEITTVRLQWNSDLISFKVSNKQRPDSRINQNNVRRTESVVNRSRAACISLKLQRRSVRPGDKTDSSLEMVTMKSATAKSG